MTTLTQIEKNIINQLQKAFPITQRPFKDAAESLQITEDDLIENIKNLMEKGIVTRFGPLFDIEKAGGKFCLCAVSVEENKWPEIAEKINAYPEVAHNYLRDHTYNLWFVLATETETKLSETLTLIEKNIGYPILALPKEREYFIGLHLEV